MPLPLAIFISVLVGMMAAVSFVSCVYAYKYLVLGQLCICGDLSEVHNGGRSCADCDCVRFWPRGTSTL